MKIKKNIPLIDQHNRNGFWGGKFGGNFIPETLKKPVEDLEILFARLRNSKKGLQYEEEKLKNTLSMQKEKTNEKDVLAKTHFSKIKELTLDHGINLHPS